MSEEKNRFTDSGVGIVWLKEVTEPANEEVDTQGIITEHSEENS
jgi:hypothetical protein